MLVSVTGENDYGTPVGIHSWENNNLAQRNVSIIRLDRPDNTIGGSSSGTSFSFVTGNKLNTDPYMEIIIDRSSLPKQAEVLLNPSDTDEYFPALKPETAEFHPNTLIKFLDRTRMLLSRSSFKGIMTLEAGSTFEDIGNSCEDNITIVSQEEAKWVTRTGKRLISVLGDKVTIRVQKQSGELRQMSLRIKIPDNVKLKHEYQIAVSQRDTKGQVVGGVSLVIEVQG